MPGFCSKNFRYVYQNSNCTRTEGHCGGNTVYDQNNICQILFGTRAESVLILTTISCTVVKTAFYVFRTPSWYLFERFFFLNPFRDRSKKKSDLSTNAETSFQVYRRTLQRETNILKDFSFTNVFLGLQRKKIEFRRFSVNCWKKCVFRFQKTILFSLDIFENSHVFQDLRRSFQIFHSFSARFLSQLSKPLFTCTDDHLI